ncbi:MAG: caspase family protein [Chitinophagaceae bacterium]|nr:caspase family protein [Chitinophagaceae bacterium]
MSFSDDGKSIITANIDNSIRVWDVVTGKEKYKIIFIDTADWIIVSPQGYYQCTPAAAKLLHYVTKEYKIITFEQLDIKYNRPDKVLEAMENKDSILIKSYKKAYEKRIKKMSIDTLAFRSGYGVPEFDFVNRDNIAYEQKKSTLTLHIKGVDSIYKLDRFNVWVNETPIFGQRGISIRKKNKNDFDTTITIKLSQGENRIETSITNVNGTESYRMPLTVNYSPAVKQKESIRFIGIGIDQFADNQYNLKYSAKDIRDLSKKLKEKYKDDIIIDTLFNANVTVSNVKGLKQKLQQTSVNDKVIISYSGHGLLSKDYDYYLSTYNVNFQMPEENGLAYDELENLLDSIPARKKLMLIDACHSGEVDKEEGIAMNKIADSLGLSKGIILGDSIEQNQNLGLKNSFELMQSLFVNVGKSTGATIISAAAGNQFALERGDLKNGVFTYSLLEAMEKNVTMKISELKKIVGERVEQLTNGMQKPTSRNETIAVDWSLW